MYGKTLWWLILITTLDVLGNPKDSREAWFWRSRYVRSFTERLIERRPESFQQPTSRWETRLKAVPPSLLFFWILSFHNPLCHPTPCTWTYSLWLTLPCNPSKLHRHRWKTHKFEEHIQSQHTPAGGTDCIDTGMTHTIWKSRWVKASVRIHSATERTIWHLQWSYKNKTWTFQCN